MHRKGLVASLVLMWVLALAIPTVAFAAPDGPQAVQHDDPQAQEHVEERGATTAAQHGEDTHADEAHGDDAHGEGGHGDEHGKKLEHLELPHLFMVLRQLTPLGDNDEFNHYSHVLENLFYALLAGTVVTLIGYRIYKTRAPIPGRLQAFGEILVEQVLSITQTMMGEKDGRKYAPFIATIFVYLLAMNYSVLIPLGKSPTATLVNNLSIALVIFLYVQYTGIRRNGIGGYLHHLMGSPKDLVGWLISPLMLFLEIIGELIKPMSLSLRLFGNIFGEDTLLAVFAVLGVVVLSLTGIPAWAGIPLHLPFLFLSMLLGLIQALVFSLLATVYITLMLPHGDHDHDHAEAH